MAITCMSAPVIGCWRCRASRHSYTKDRALVVMLPVDYLFWTSRVARVAQALTASVPSQPRIARRELWIAGNVSPRARQEFEAMGWTVYEQVSAQLNPPA